MAYNGIKICLAVGRFPKNQPVKFLAGYVMALPFEVAIIGNPVSQQTRNRDRLRRWMGEIWTAARRHWDEAEPYEGSVMVTVIYFSQGVAFDLDNIPKPVLDALKGLVFRDDNQVTDLICRKIFLSGNWEIFSESVALNEALIDGSEFLHIVVEQAPEQETITWYRTRLLLRAS